MHRSASRSAALGIGIVPREDESLPGFVVRLAMRLETTPRHVAAMGGILQPGAATGPTDLARFAALVDMPVSAIEALCYHQTGRSQHHRFGLGIVHRDLIDLSHRRACPPCLRDSAHHRAAWDLALVTACPLHGVRLAARCPSCGRKQGWATDSLLRCRCGSDVLAWPTTAVDAIEHETATRAISLAYGDGAAWIGERLAGCDSGDILRVAVGLGMFLSGWRGRRSIERLCAAGPDRVATVMAAGIDAVARWPDPLLEFLEGERKKSGSRPGRYGARKTLGPFYTWIRDFDAPDIRSAMAEVARQSGANDPGDFRRWHRSELVSAIGGDVVSMSEAARLLGCSHETTRRLMASGLLPGTSEGRGVPVMLEHVTVQALAARRADGVSVARAASLLGVSRERMRAILASPEISIGWTREPGFRSSGTISVTDVNSFLEQVGKTAPVNASVSVPTVGFGTAVEAFRLRGIGLPRFLSMVLDGSLAVSARVSGAVGVQQLRFAKAVVRTACRSLEAAGTLSVQATAEKLGLKWEVVAFLVRMNLIVSGPDGIPEPAVDAFQVEFVTGAELAKLAGRSPRGLMAHLARLGVRPASGPSVDGGR